MKSRYNIIPDAREIYINDLAKEIVKKVDIYIDENITADEKKDLLNIVKKIIEREAIYKR